MSDAQTDIQRDNERYRLYEMFLRQLAIWLGAPNQENMVELKSRAQETDSVPRGYSNSPTCLLPAVEKGTFLKKLQDKDPEEWKNLLDCVEDPEIRILLERYSPFVAT